MKSVGLLGGTFNPIHHGHLKLARQAMEEYGLTEVWFIPSGTPPHKEVRGHVTTEDRLSLCRAALDGEKGFVLKETESYSLLPSYSYKTVSYYREHYPDIRFYYIIGEDSLRYFHLWVHPEVIVSCADILVAARSESIEKAEKTENNAPHEPHESISDHYPGMLSGDAYDFEGALNYVKEHLPGQYHVLHMPEVPISSTAIRQRIEEGLDVADMLPDAALSYIREHRLYRASYSMVEIEELTEKLQKKLKGRRYQHTVGVMQTAAALAGRYSYPIYDAMMAGLLHDCAKYLDEEEYVKQCKRHSIPVTDSEQRSPGLLHAKLGAYFAKKRYGIEDPAILHAITVHTTGCPEMSLLDKIIFVADYIEPGRDKAANLSELRSIAFRDLDLCVALISYQTIHYLTGRNKVMDQATVETFEYYKALIAERGTDISLIVNDKNS